ncbi:PREDICTED: 28S ribosomal protein S2, mitochondrial [Atta cephalotes]|uniref:Small ribosomal subunit protein uS2m n=2 Tax=Atta TaxID=12956 RepID=A0A158NWW8_ATTCE|nr:PREDICTED: 28S ribosomal protein S2, mitochondrial [Atta cephalotes]XP_018059853.1 PREDICTED: 28S ribosomal protein S2, mitochondrial [Atta colombica]
MSIFTRRILSCIVSREWQCLRPVVCNTHLRQCQLSTQSQPSLESDLSNIPESSEVMLDPLTHPDFFQVHKLFTVKDLYDARVHYGHKEISLNEHMETFIFGSRLGHLIIDLDQTAELLRQALNFTAHIAFRGGIILFISRNPQVTHLVDKTAKECKEFSQTRFWRQGLFPNSRNQFKAMTRLPDLCIFLSTLDTVMTEHTAVRHTAKMCIPSVGIVDTNCNPNLITYPVPGNDDSLCAIQLYCSLFKEAIMRGKRAREQMIQSAKST